MHFRSTYAFWIIILVITGLIVFAIWLVRVNPPPAASDAEVAKPVWTEGVVQSGVARIEAGKTLSFPLNLNQRRFLRVFFRTDSRDHKISARIFTGSDLDSWTNDAEIKPFITTNPVSRGNIRRLIEAGKYVVVLDNRNGTTDVILDPLLITVE